MVQCCPTGGTAEVQCEPTVSRRVAYVEGSRGTVLSRRVRSTAWKDPMVQCCPIGCTSEPGDVKGVDAEVHVDLDVCVIVLIATCGHDEGPDFCPVQPTVTTSEHDAGPDFLYVVVVVSIMYRVSVIVFQSIISR